MRTHIGIYMYWETYLQGTTHKHKRTHTHGGTHALRNIYRGCMLGDACTRTHTWGCTHRDTHGDTFTEETQGKYAWKTNMLGGIYTQGDTYA